MNTKQLYHAGLYCRLSKDDDQLGESVSISTQRAILSTHCQEQGYKIFDVYIDDGYSGLNFERPDFQRLLTDIKAGKVNMVLTKDLSRLGRDYIMTGYYSEIFFPSQGVRYIALNDNYDSSNSENDIAPFKNILNEMYAKDISRKVKSAKRQQAKDGKVIGGQAPYGYVIKNHKLMVDPEAAQVVQMIFELASQGLGEVEICKQLELRKIETPGYYKEQHGKIDSTYYRDKQQPYRWNSRTVHKILNDQVYIGNLITLKTETVNYKTKQRVSTPQERRFVTLGAHEAIVTQEQIEKAKLARQHHICPASYHRENIFRGILYCDCCGHQLSIAHRKLTHREDDLYRCMHHHYHTEECPRTHAIYHSMLYPYVLSQVRAFAKSMKKRKIQSPLLDFGEITELTPDILKCAIERIEVGHVSRKSIPSKVVKIYWKLT